MCRVRSGHGCLYRGPCRLYGLCSMHGRQDIRIGSGRWVESRHPRQGFRLRLPSELRVYFEKQNGREWAAQNMMPFDYVNFRPQGRGFEGENVFELDLGVQ